MRRPGFDIRNLLIAYCEDVQIELRRHRNLQSQHCGARGRDRQRPLRDPRQNVGFVAHVFAPSDCESNHA
jgi:hypothetical protein